MRVLRAWLLVEELSRGHSDRLARMAEDYAEEDEPAATAAPGLVAVGMGI